MRAPHLCAVPMRLALVTALALLPASLCARSEADFEREPVLDAVELVGPALLHGPGYSVAPQAPVVGYQARFTLRTKYGEIEAGSVEMLGVRIAEVPALEALYGEEVSAVLAKTAAQSVQDSGNALWQLVRHPVATVAGLPRGVARYFGERLRKLGERAQKLGDRAHRRVAEDGSPYDHPQGPMSAGRPPSRAERTWRDKSRKELLNLVKGELDYGSARRQWAQRLGIDPQTSNPLIGPRLDALAWAAVASRRGVGHALGAFGPAANEVLGTGGKVHAAVWSLAPADLRARNRARISPWCRDETLLRRFLQHKAFSATLQTSLSESLRALAPASGCEALLETALMAQDEQEGRFVVNALRLLRQHLGRAAVGGELLPLGATVIYRAPDGELVLPLAVDRLSWTRQMSDFFDADRLRADGRTLLVTGSISLRAQRELTQRGWSLVPHLPYPGAPPYAVSPVQPPTGGPG
jgi:hypothetical protein